MIRFKVKVAASMGRFAVNLHNQCQSLDDDDDDKNIEKNNCIGSSSVT
jgi:hypothetical protein